MKSSKTFTDFSPKNPAQNCQVDLAHRKTVDVMILRRKMFEFKPLMEN